MRIFDFNEFFKLFLQQQQANIRKLYKHQYNTQNKQYKTYREQVLNQTPKDQVREKLEQIKDEQNRKFSLLYEHYKTNVDAVYQQQNLKLNAAQQLEQDQLHEDLERQMSVLLQSHTHRKRHQADMFAKELAHLDNERNQKHKDLVAKMEHENDEFERSSKQRLNKLSEMQRILIENVDKGCADKYGLQMQQQQQQQQQLHGHQLTNRHSVYHVTSNSGGGAPSRSASGSCNNKTSSSLLHNHNAHLSYFGSADLAEAQIELTASKNFAKTS